MPHPRAPSRLQEYRREIAQRDRIERAVEDYSRSEQSTQSLLRPGEKYGWVEKMAREMMTTVAPLTSNTTEWFKRAEQIVTEEASLRTRGLDDLKTLELELNGYLSVMRTSLERLEREVARSNQNIQAMRARRTKWLERTFAGRRRILRFPLGAATRNVASRFRGLFHL